MPTLRSLQTWFPNSPRTLRLTIILLSWSMPMGLLDHSSHLSVLPSFLMGSWTNLFDCASEISMTWSSKTSTVALDWGTTLLIKVLGVTREGKEGCHAIYLDVKPLRHLSWYWKLQQVLSLQQDPERADLGLVEIVVKKLMMITPLWYSGQAY